MFNSNRYIILVISQVPFHLHIYFSVKIVIFSAVCQPNQGDFQQMGNGHDIFVTTYSNRKGSVKCDFIHICGKYVHDFTNFIEFLTVWLWDNPVCVYDKFLIN